MEPVEILSSGLSELDLAVDQSLIQQLQKYQSLLLRWNKTTNLTAITEPEKIVTHHLLEGWRRFEA